ncbi:hypothetical protein ABZ763_19615 [Streptomyces bacillaris]|uniref:hypothetical protein n=1 Tax=Streptomyces bacillaris TaxID=68179 RepID=UPI003461642A
MAGWRSRTILEHDLSGVRLVTLAACASALGRFDRADNVRGVPAALVELVPGLVNTAEVLVAAELERRSWGIRRYRARLGPTSRGITLSTVERGPQPPADAD